MSDFWTIDRVDTLMTMAAEGKTFSQIGAVLGVTRSCAIGKYQRIRVARGHVPTPRKRVLSGEAPAPRKVPSSRKLPSMPATASTVAPMPAKIALPVPAPLSGPAVGLLDVTGCKWPLHEDASLIGGYAFCNHDKDEGSSYCPYHAREAVADYSRTLIDRTVKAAMRKHLYGHPLPQNVVSPVVRNILRKRVAA